MTMRELHDLIFSPNPNEELANVRRAMSDAAKNEWETGARLAWAQENKQYLQVTINGRRPTNWADYLKNFVKIAPSSAYRLIDAAYFPEKYSVAYGLDAMATLRKIVALTDAEETPEEAIALLLPLGNGEKKPFCEMTVEQVTNAYRILTSGEDVPVAGKAVADSKPPERLAWYQRTFVNVLEGYMQARQVRVRQDASGDFVVDLRSLPIKKLRDILSCLSRIPD